MSAIIVKFTDGPITATVLEAVTGGQLLEARANGVGVAAAGSTTVLGVAQKDATNATPASTDSDPLPSTVPVVVEGNVLVTYAAAATFGQPLKAAAAGQVTPMVLGTDADHLCVGRCWEPAGVAAAATGYMRIGVYGNS